MIFDHLDGAAIRAKGIEACSRDSCKGMTNLVVHFGVSRRKL